MELGDLNKVWEIKSLKKPGQEEAKKMLERIAKQVQPIMRKYKWRVKLLSEFCPKNPRLLGLNVGGGIHVKLRLRRPNRDWDFYAFEQVLDTMLHELCHNAHGPHNASFYQLWDELRKECEDIMAKGISGTGQGFDLPGRRLGGFSRQPPLSSLRQTALAAAQKRQSTASLLPPGPNRLGGDKSIMSALSPIQAAAMAAERRLQDEIWCASASGHLPVEEENDADFQGSHQNIDRSAASSIVSKSTSSCAASSSVSKSCSGPFSTTVTRKRSIDDAFSARPGDCNSNNFVDLTTTSTSSSSNYARSGKRLQSYSNPLSVIDQNIQLDSCSAGAHKDEVSMMWECETCTLLNPPLAPICEVCGTAKAKVGSAKYKFWSCKFCTLENGVELDKCSACGQWRYSHGASISTGPPNLGT